MKMHKMGKGKMANKAKAAKQVKTPYSDRDSMSVMGKRQTSGGAASTVRGREKRLMGKAM
jgi:hypothetical protein